MLKQTPMQDRELLRRKHKRREYFFSYLMILPAIIAVLIFVIYPMINLVQLSLFTGNAANAYKKFVGLQNYNQILFVRPEFLNALKNTAYYTAAVVVLLITFSVIFAVWMQKPRRLNNFAQTAFFTPHLVASISCAFIWSWLYNGESYGLLNSVLKIFGIPPHDWLGKTDTAMNSIIIMNVWKSIGYYALIIMSALKAIPVEIYEAARLDNSSTLRTFFKITLPMLTPQLFFLLITITTGSFKVFDSIKIMTAGGPGTSTQVLCMFIYQFAFQRPNSLGLAAAGGVGLMVILILITLLDFKGLEKKVHYQ